MYGISPPTPWRVLACPTCSRVVVYAWGGKRNRKYCSQACRPKRFRPRVFSSTQSACEQCGVGYERRFSFQRFCSDKCRHDCRNGNPAFKAELLRRYHLYMQTDRGRAVGKRRRLRRKRRLVGDAEVVVAAQVFERDGWRCQLCGCRVRQTGSNYHFDRATMDHIVPISRGGRHTYANIQTACNLCNSKKSAKSAGQFRLF